MPANSLGARSYYGYTADSGDTYSYLTDDDLATSVGATLEDGNEPFPRRFKPRGVYVQATVAGKVLRKFVICPDSTAAPYSQNTSATVTIDGTAFKTTGRRGESMSFANN